jgi:membrane-associated protein
MSLAEQALDASEYTRKTLMAGFTTVRDVGNSPARLDDFKARFDDGSAIGPRVFRYEDSWFFKKAYLARTHRYFERYGGRTIIIARFVPIVRTYAPFVAGVGQMEYGRFILFNVAGAVVWVALIAYAGYLFGNVPLVQNNLTLVIFGIILLSISPAIVEVLRHKLKRA